MLRDTAHTITGVCLVGLLLKCSSQGVGAAKSGSSSSALAHASLLFIKNDYSFSFSAEAAIGAVPIRPYATSFSKSL